MRRNLIFGVAILGYSLLCVPVAQADSLNFSGSTLSSTGGTFTFTPGAGQNLDISKALITGLQSGLCASKCTVTGGYLTIDSGAQTSFSSGTYTFAAGGQLALYGEIDALGITSAVELASASFLAGQSLQISNTTGTFRALVDPNSVVLNPLLSTDPLIALNGTDTESEFQISLNPLSGSYTGNISRSAVTINTDPVPEPASILLLGSSLLSACGIRRNWKR